MKKVIVIISIIFLSLTAYFTTKQFFAGQENKNYTQAIVSPVESLNPILGSTADSATVIYQLYNTLYVTKYDKIIPSGAKDEPTISTDGLDYTIKLTETYWVNSKGEKQSKVKAKDYEYAFKALIDINNKSQYTTLLAEANIKNAQNIIDNKASIDELGVKAIDDETLKITLEIPTPYLTDFLSHSKLSPISYENVEKNGGLEKTFSSFENVWYSGAYYISKEKVNEEYVLTANKHFFDEKNVQIDQVNVKILKDMDTVYKEFESNNLNQASITKKELVQAQKDQKTTVKVVRGGTAYLALNQDSKIIQNNNVRKALMYGVDYNKIVEETIGLGSKGSSTYIPEGLTTGLYGEDTKKYTGDLRKYDLEKAKQFAALAKEQLGQEIELKMIAQESINDKKFAEAFQGQVKQNIDFNIKLEFLSAKEYRLRARKDSSLYDIMVSSWIGAYSDPSTFLAIVDPQNPQLNFTRNNDATLSQKIKEAQKEKNTSKRLELFAKAEEYLVVEQTYVIPYQLTTEYIATNGKYKFEPTKLRIPLFRFHVKN